MSGQVKLLIITGVITIGLIVGAAFIFGRGDSGSESNPVSNDILVGTDTFTVGDPNAPVTLVEFADFQCPGCGAANPIVNELLNKKGDQIYFVFRHFPLNSHPHAKLAAQVVEAAGAQGKFAEMKDMVFEGQADWSVVDNPLDIFQGYADDLKLDREKFDKSIESEEFLEKINQGVSDGNEANVDSTPSFFINGVLHEGNFDLESLDAAINEELGN